MLCPKCHSEYLNHLKKCGDCKTDLISASPIDLPIPEMMWSPLIPFDGKIYADMAAELLDNNSIPYYFKMDWASSAFSIEATTITGQIVRIFVPKEHLDKANRLASSVTGKRT